ncbi:hypothetical protein CAC42_5935 [Sphaceloma murrayae]|uniref:Uncharacterized protein n=1 Tax=Sphaceloma murrayae TaxID=2082308 RepID=A0A2K1QZL2_9PEZI|nr:hypothetical protein CAC42_5935 [Sphaceloma murrayae]
MTFMSRSRTRPLIRPPSSEAKTHDQHHRMIGHGTWSSSPERPQRKRRRIDQSLLTYDSSVLASGNTDDASSEDQAEEGVESEDVQHSISDQRLTRTKRRTGGNHERIDSMLSITQSDKPNQPGYSDVPCPILETGDWDNDQGPAYIAKSIEQTDTEHSTIRPDEAVQSQQYNQSYHDKSPPAFVRSETAASHGMPSPNLAKELFKGFVSNYLDTKAQSRLQSTDMGIDRGGQRPDLLSPSLEQNDYHGPLNDLGQLLQNRNIQLESARQERDEAFAEVSELREGIREADSIMARQDEVIESLQIENQTAREDAEQMQSRLDEVVAQYEAAKSSVDSQKDSVASLRTELAGTKVQLEAVQKDLNDKDVRRMSREKDYWEKQARMWHREALARDQEIEKLTAQLLKKSDMAARLGANAATDRADEIIRTEDRSRIRG